MANMYSSINFLFYEIENNFKGGLTFIFYSSKSLQIHNIYLLHFLYVFCACHWESIRVWVCRGTRGRLWFAPFNTIFGCFPLYIWESIRVWVCRGTRGRLWFCTIQYNLWMFSPLYVCQTLLKNRVCQTFCQDINSLQIGSHKWQTCIPVSIFSSMKWRSISMCLVLSCFTRL
ncbi:uncharacterized protein [Cicer arietinum]|uniref:uncharacterized protein isoform X3 n=1 Tax=Cicer arietinum TaxID=3827 RepID=UPI003CC56107